jgi:hypothetical protein
MEEPNILIKTALNEAVQYVNQGNSPTEALKKVAEEMDLNPNYIQRTGEALNVALHYRHFKTAEDRAEEFAIADIPKVITDALSVSEKSAAKTLADNFITPDSDDVVFNYNRILNNPQYKQAYLEIANSDEQHDSFPTRVETLYEKSAQYIEKLARQVEETEIHKVAAELHLNDVFCALTHEFRKDAAARTSFEEFESQVFSKYGELAVPYLDLIHKTAAREEERGVHDKGYIMFEPTKEAVLFDRLIESAHELVALEKEAADALENYKYESAFAKEAYKEFKKTADIKNSTENASETKAFAGDLQKDAAEDPVLDAVKKKVSDPEFTIAKEYAKDPVIEAAAEKTAAGFNRDPLGDFLKGTFVDNLRSRLGGAAQSRPTKPNLTLENMERKLLLQELMLTDPILSRVNPVRVAKAYEQLLRLSPETSKEKEVVRAQLRAMVASQALSAHDADLMTKLDVDMLKRRIATQAFNSGLTEQFRI